MTTDHNTVEKPRAEVTKSAQNQLVVDVAAKKL